jgi:pyroglutamyl-peptidase
MRRRSTILLTGFGPFPGMPENASAILVPKLAHLVARRFPSHRVVARVLPTEWEAGPARLKSSYAREKPALAIHFGVSDRARGFVIETLARNVRCDLPDAAGATAASAAVVEAGPGTRPATIPARDIATRLAALGYAASLSDDAGVYLCNCLLYHSLVMAESADPPAVAGFVHIPSSLIRAGAARAATHLDWESALLGGLEIVRACLGRPAPARTAERVKPR